MTAQTTGELDRLLDTQPHRSVDMQVLCLGFSRTGTMSMYTAFQKLGYNSYHFLEVSMHNKSERHLECWHEALTNKLDEGKPIEPAQLDKLLGKYSATTDAPCVNFTDELLKLYPNAKVILTNRDLDSWIKSVENSFFKVLEWPAWRWLSSTHPRFLIYTNTLILVLRDYSTGHWQDRAALRQGFINHYAHVREVVPKERLLEHHFGDGWEPLCEFLGKPVPDEPYPHINEGNNTHNMHMKAFWWRSIIVAGKALLWSSPAVATGIAIWIYKSR